MFFREKVNSKVNMDKKAHSRFSHNDSITSDIALGPLSPAGVMSTTALPADDMSITVAPALTVLVYKPRAGELLRKSVCGENPARRGVAPTNVASDRNV